MLNIRKDFGELLKTKLQKAKTPEELKATLISLLTEAKGLFQKKGDPDFAAILAHAVELAESGDVKNAIVVTAKACKG
jgi:hypothetical protein